MHLSHCTVVPLHLRMEVNSDQSANNLRKCLCSTFSDLFLVVVFLGEKNSLLANDMAFETVKAPWSPENKIHRMRMVKKVIDTEDKAAFRLHEKMPRYIYFAANSTNKWDLNRGYRIQMVSFSGDHLPETDPMERAISWGR